MHSLNRQIYLDYNATTPLLDVARRALIEALDVFGNPASVHMQGRAAKAIMQKARRELATLLEAESDHIIFTSGATEAANTLLTPNYFMGRAPLALSHLYIGATEHPCILAGGQFAPEHITIVPALTNGLIDQQALQKLLSNHDHTNGLPLVAIQYANHETGIIQPIAQISTLVKQAGGLFIVDAVQAVGKETISCSKLEADFLIISAHKMGGPKGVGAFIAAGPLIMPQPLFNGGGQERGHRAGTPAMALIAAFGAAATHAQHMNDEQQRLANLRTLLEVGIRNVAAKAIIYGEAQERLANTCFFTIPTIKAETLAIALDLEGIAISNGSACSSGKVGTSSVLKAMNVAGDEGAIRVSTGSETTEDDINYFLQTLTKILKRSQ